MSPLTPSDALFVDFESLEKPPTPAILGVLKVVKGVRTFEQIILDSRLVGAAVGHPLPRFSEAEPILATLIDTGLPIVGWSLFDRDLVGSLPIADSVKRTWAERYVNALAIARTWRSKVHPMFKVTKDLKFNPKHTLDKYAEFAGYPQVDKLKDAEPAKWIRHVRNQLEARRYYRQITSQAKRDWHWLLEYNQHDCYALRHVYERASFELQKWGQYERATYCVEDGGRTICFRAGNTIARLDTLLERYGAVRWAFLTAWNPASRQLSRAENDVRQRELIESLTASGHRCLRGEGRGHDPSWPAEESVLALDISKRAARRFGRQFGQLAVVVGHRGFASRLVACG